MDFWDRLNVFSCNFNEAKDIFKTKKSMKAASLLGELVEYGIITIDKEGALGVCNGKIIEFPAPSVKVIDPSGAGDVFWGSFMGCLISAKDFRKAMKASIKMAVRNIMHIGTSAFINIE